MAASGVIRVPRSRPSRIASSCVCASSSTSTAHGGELREPSRPTDAAEPVAEFAADREPALTAALGAAVQELDEEESEQLGIESRMDQVMDTERPQALAQRQEVLAVRADPDRLARLLVAALEHGHRLSAPRVRDQEIARSFDSLAALAPRPVLEVQLQPTQDAAHAPELAVVEQDYRRGSSHRVYIGLPTRSLKANDVDDLCAEHQRQHRTDRRKALPRGRHAVRATWTGQRRPSLRA
jgi:hypothetical protein